MPIFPRRTHYQRQFPAYGDVVVLGAVFQAMGISAYSMIISMIGRLVVLLPVAYVLAKMFGLMSIWRGVPDCRGRFIHRYDGFLSGSFTSAKFVRCTLLPMPQIK